jgi:hypothetical protein
MTACAGAEWETTPGSSTSNRVCASHSTCVTGQQWQSKPAAAGSDRECQSISQCDYAIQFEELAPTTTSDRRCAPLSACNPDTQFESQPKSATSDRACSSLTTCLYTIQFESVPSTPTSDRTCSELTACDYSAQYRSTDKTSTSDRVCLPLTQCTSPFVGSHLWEVHAPTHTSDRTCAPVTICGQGQTMLSTFTATADRQCLTICPAGHRQTKARVSNTDNTECELCPDGQYAPLAGNDPTCEVCARGHKASDDRKSCYAWSCSHLHCRLETHKCANKRGGGKDCTGTSVHRSIRVFHGGCSGAPAYDFKCQETVCTNGHHCGMGFLTGDTSKCECRPTLPRHHFLPYKHLRVPLGMGTPKVKMALGMAGV